MVSQNLALRNRLLAALEEAWRLSDQAAETLRVTRRPGSYARLRAIKEAINDYAECEMEHREYFW